MPIAEKNATIKNMSKLTVYKTYTMADSAQRVMDALTRVDGKRLDVTHTVIVPDRASLEAERYLLKTLGGSFNVCVKTFRRLAADVLPKYEYLSKQAGILAISGIIKDCREELVCFTKGVDTAGFAENVYDAVSMMKYCRVKPRDLLRDLPKSVEGKAKDIALIYERYLQYTENRFIDSADKLDLLCDAIAQTDIAENGYFYLYDFDNFSAQELRIVEQLLLKSKGVTVACCAGDEPLDNRLFLNDIYDSVMQLAKRNGIDPVIVESKRFNNAYVAQIGNNLFRYGETQPVEAGDFAEIYEGATRLDEVYALACRIQQYVRQGGDRRFGDVYAVTSDVAKYASAISTVFEQFEIPYFCDRQYALSDHPYARFVTDYLTLCRNNGKLVNVLSFVKNCLFCDEDESVYAFENYCLKYNVSFRYDSFGLGKDEPIFSQADAFRARFNALFGKIKAPDSATVKQYVDFVRELILTCDLNEKNERLEESQRRHGMEFESKVTAQAADKFESVLVQTERVLGERYVKLDEFIRLFSTGLASVKISVIPVYNDCVIFANMAKARKHDVKFLALLGANQGAMPIVKSDTKLLSDRNLRDLASGGVNLEPQIFTENRRERFSLFQLLLEPSKLYVSYADNDGQDRLMPSSFVNELCKLFTSHGKTLAPDSKEDGDVYTEKQACAKLAASNRRVKDNRPVNVPSYEALRELYGEKIARYETVKDGKNIKVPRGAELYLKNSATSVSQLTDFFKCPYRFYVQYGLNVKPRTVSELKSSDLGNVLHAVLETYVRDADVNESDDVTEQKAREKFEAAMNDDFYRGLKNDVKMVGILSQLQSESIRMCKVVKKQLRDSDFTNYATELSFGSGDIPPVTVQFDGGSFRLVGKIDRVDVCDGRFTVIDYKSGAKAASYGEKELYVGHKLQLPVYVKAVEDLLHTRPAGFYYFNMHDNFADVKGDDYVYNGRTLADKEVACRIDRNLQNGRSVKLGLSLKADGEFNMQSGKTRLLDDAQFDSQVDYAFALIRRAGNLMKEGYAAVNPYDKTCDYCDYKDICDFGDTYTYNARKVNSDVDKNTIDRTVENEKRNV